MQRGVLCAALIATMATPLRPQPPRGNRLARTQARAQSPLTEARAGPADALELERRFRACDDPSLAPVVHGALDVLDGALRVFGPSRVFASFNGGKDAAASITSVDAEPRASMKTVSQTDVGRGARMSNEEVFARKRIAGELKSKLTVSTAGSVLCEDPTFK